MLRDSEHFVFLPHSRRNRYLQGRAANVHWHLFQPFFFWRTIPGPPAPAPFSPYLYADPLLGRLKGELRRALIMAGDGSFPPTIKDVEDLATLLASQSPSFLRGVVGAVGCCGVDASMLLRALRGDSNPRREQLARDIYRRWTAKYAVSCDAGDGSVIGESKGGSSGRVDGDMDTNQHESTPLQVEGTPGQYDGTTGQGDGARRQSAGTTRAASGTGRGGMTGGGSLPLEVFLEYCRSDMWGADLALLARNMIMYT